MSNVPFARMCRLLGRLQGRAEQIYLILLLFLVILQHSRTATVVVVQVSTVVLRTHVKHDSVPRTIHDSHELQNFGKFTSLKEFCTWLPRLHHRLLLTVFDEPGVVFD